MTSVVASVQKRIMRPRGLHIRLPAVAVDTYFVLPAGYALSAWYIQNTTANAVTGGLDIGTTDGGVDIASAFAVAGSAIKHIAEASLLLRYFSKTATQNIYVIAHTAWNSASLDFDIFADKVSP